MDKLKAIINHMHRKHNGQTTKNAHRCSRPKIKWNPKRVSSTPQNQQTFGLDQEKYSLQLALVIIQITTPTHHLNCSNVERDKVKWNLETNMQNWHFLSNVSALIGL